MPRKKKGPVRRKRTEPKGLPRKKQSHTKATKRVQHRARTKSTARKSKPTVKKKSQARKKSRAPQKRRSPKQPSKASARSRAAKKGWTTRRARAFIPGRSDYKWQRWIFGWKIQIAATLLYSTPPEGKVGERIVSEDVTALMKAVKARMPNARLYGGCILYKRSADGKKWDEGIVPKYLDWKRSWDDAHGLFDAMARGFYNDLTNPDRFQHAYKVKIVGLAARACGKRNQDVKEEEGNQPTLPGIVSDSRSERMKRRLGDA